MNIIDYCLLAVLLSGAAFGLYRHCVSAALGFLSALIAIPVALLCGRALAAALGGNAGLTGILTTYTDANSLIGDVSLAATRVVGISEGAVNAIMKSVQLPETMRRLLYEALTHASLSHLGMETVNQYISYVIVSVMLRVGSFVLCYFAAFLLLHFLVNLVDHVVQFPMLKLFDGLLAAVFGLLRGAAVLYVLMLLLPVLNAVIPLEILRPYIGTSTLSPLFESESLLALVTSGIL